MRLRVGEALGAGGRTAEVDKELARALDFYSSVGAAAFERRAEALLAAAA
jgi:hypothetical protein